MANLRLFIVDQSILVMLHSLKCLHCKTLNIKEMFARHLMISTLCLKKPPNFEMV